MKIIRAVLDSGIGIASLMSAAVAAAAGDIPRKGLVQKNKQTNKQAKISSGTIFLTVAPNMPLEENVICQFCNLPNSLAPSEGLWP